MTLEALAIVLAADQKAEQALKLFAACDAYRQMKGYPLPQIDQEEHERWLARAQAGCDERTFAKAWDEGQLMTLEQAMDYALEAAG